MIMYTDEFENMENPQFIENYIMMMKRAENEAELEEMFKNGDLTDKDFQFEAVDADEIQETQDLPF